MLLKQYSGRFAAKASVIDLINLAYHTAGVFATRAADSKHQKTRSPAGPRRQKKADTRHRRASAFFGCSLPKCENEGETLHIATRMKRRVSTCESLCAIL